MTREYFTLWLMVSYYQTGVSLDSISLTGYGNSLEDKVEEELEPVNSPFLREREDENLN